MCVCVCQPTHNLKVIVDLQSCTNVSAFRCPLIPESVTKALVHSYLITRRLKHFNVLSGAKIERSYISDLQTGESQVHTTVC